MDINDMISMAFEQGTGMKRSSVARSARFKELLAETPDGEFVTAYERAEMLYLGERLADAAFKRLPANVRRDALRLRHDRGTDATLFIARLYTTLHDWAYAPKNLARRQQKSSTKADDSATVLPLRYGLSVAAAAAPACLGMAQMLCGFARAAGVHYVVVDTLVRYDSAAVLGNYLGHVRMGDVLSRHAELSCVRVHKREVEYECWSHRYDLSKLLSQTDYAQAHHALLMSERSGERKWYLVDPYMRLMYGCQLEEEDLESFEGGLLYDQTITQYTEPFDPSVFEDSAQGTDELLTMLEKMSNGEFAEGKCEWLLETIRAFSVFFAEEARAIQSLRQQFPHTFLPESQIPTDEKAIEARMLKETFGAFLREDERLCIEDGVSCDAAAVYLAAIQRQPTKRALRRACNRFAGIFLRYEYDRQVQAFELFDVHPLIECNTAEYHLAVMTVNHLAARYAVDAADLLRHRPYSQSLIRDTLTAVLASDDPRVKNAHRKSVQYLRRFLPQEVLPALHSFLSEKE